MKTTLLRPILLAASLGLTPLAFAETTAFTWQGRVTDAGQPANGLYDLTFQLFDDSTGGTALGTNTFPGTVLSNGTYTATLDFGADAFNGDARWLELALRTNGAADFTTLAPRQAVTPTPYAIRAANAGSVSGTIPDAQLSANVARLNATNTFTGPVSLNGSLAVGTTNLVPDLNAGLLGGKPASTFWQLGGNSGSIPGTNFLGTTDNQPLEMKVSGQRAMRLEAGSESPNVVLGSVANFVAPGLFGATIAGGGTANRSGVALPNQVLREYGTIGGGGSNVVASAWTTAAGGFGNVIGTDANMGTISGGTLNYVGSSRGTISGGEQNRIGTNAPFSTIAGGVFNTIADNSRYSAIAGGYLNLITNGGAHATICGGYGNVASGLLSFAAGNQAHALHDGTFVWGDSTSADFASTGPNQFLVRASGGVGIGTVAPAAALHVKGGAAGLLVERNAADGGGAFTTFKNSRGDLGYVGKANNADYSPQNCLVLSSDAVNNHMAILPNGNVGIGTTRPNQGKLVVVNSDASTSVADQTRGTVAIMNSDLTAGNFSLITFHDGQSAVATAGLGTWNITHSTGSPTSAGDLALFTKPSGVTTLSERMRITSSGNVGIGTTMPGLPLTIQRAAATGDMVSWGNDSHELGRLGYSASNNGGWVGLKTPTGSWGVSLDAAGPSSFTGGNVGIGTTAPTAKLEVAGSLKVSGAGNSITTPILSITGGSDVAEPFAMSGGEIPPGAVVVIDAAHPGQLKLSGEAYDKRVAGIVSGAGGVNPGLTLSQRELVSGGQNVALTGRVYALADAANGPIEPGDLLTTSAVPGHAMKVTDHAIAQGAILGKAMSRLESGQGLVLVLVTLQ